MTVPISLDTVAAESFYHEWIPEYIYLLHTYTTDDVQYSLLYEDLLTRSRTLIQYKDVILPV